MSLLPLGFPGWKKIGWHIGKKLHDILNPPSSADRPSKEELRAQRLSDVAKGFAYFNIFEEVIEWSVSDVDPLQQANTPLIRRPCDADYIDRLKPAQRKRTRTLLCHDFKGGYLDCDSARPKPSRDAVYSCEYLQSVDIFVYFSHHLVTVPPPTWTNCLHTNGVKALGTFIVEPQTSDVSRIFDLEDDGFVIARQLAAMTEAFGFDGWLLNFEREFEENSTGHILDFVEDLKARLGPDRLVLWYDALSIQNKVEYQNSLTHRNTRFVQKVDGLFTNYEWNLAKLEQSCNYADKCGISYPKLYFGIDVWAQNNDTSGPPRITFPEKEGGGTNTGLVSHTFLGLERLIIHIESDSTYICLGYADTCRRWCFYCYLRSSLDP